MVDKVEKNKETVFRYLETTIEVMSKDKYPEIDWFEMARFLCKEMIENRTNFEK
jgi:hypothetical protein